MDYFFRRVHRYGVFFLFSLLVSWVPALQAQPIKLLASIKPIQLIAVDMLGDLADVDVLLPPGSSPHHYSLKPSSVADIHEADLFIWGGEGLELFLTKTVSQLERPALALLEPSEHEEHADEHTGEHEHEDDHDATHEHEDEHMGEHEHADEHHHDGDPHFWMTPEQALAAADKIKDRLVTLYPQQAELFEQAYQDFASRLNETDQQLQQQLKPISDEGFYVFHDAFGGFVEHYQLNQLGYFTVDPGRKPGARRLAEIRETLEANKGRCVFVEPQFKAPVVDSLTRGLDIRVGRLDPLAIDIQVGRGGYSDYLKSLAASFVGCLSAE
ncbi:zinc ABC transporter substrate-binding protein ZnuA [Amphritea sp. 1_MG-2023]|uniref:zinc ABC transporter substrate-binding protein ZnuA n=1 Tax=Amphritea sp. 1_MG-2023 TaxID=3062670 RepID=UPI0026E2B45C|nr:zinc ABC transporter substrate-binding protein ZnuA [Amphritea sp. 1_MG-2023]MDO6562333.1 zinc ABC transporter substrate-binding protein ZnuA [Amphritea sp. 1_MG-2023]